MLKMTLGEQRRLHMIIELKLIQYLQESSSWYDISELGRLWKALENNE